MANTTTITYVKGDRIRASWLACEPACLAGAQMKLGAKPMTVTGVVRHIRGDHPTNPTTIRVYVDPDGDWQGPTVEVVRCTCGHPHVELQPEWVEAILT